ncbi:glutathione S-transferase [Marinomonas dokdonensis]|uniref:glutathione S-transferase n=1 Tax=Marinomonas dokdonensis TaxID=328224 RepID=UPI00405537A3
MLPVLYSFRRCPYAIRARYCLALLQVPVALREVVLKDKPAQLLALGGRTTVPQLIDTDGRRYEESADIMHFALSQSKLENRVLQLWPTDSRLNFKIHAWINYNDNHFKYWLDRYKYADRYPEHSEEHYRSKACVFLHRLNERLNQQSFLLGEEISLADIAVFPFIRQFSGVDATWFNNSEYDAVKAWLKRFLDSKVFELVMKKYQPWQSGQEEIVFP